jgi:hypothetical protein
MARGWESKSIEVQQEEAAEKPAHTHPPMTTAEAAKWREKEGLRLSRERVQHQIECSQDARHRSLLVQALAALNEKLAKLG